MDRERISEEEIKKIIEIIKFHHGFSPKKEDILNIDVGLKNSYAVSHRQRIISEIIYRQISKELLRHRDRIGSQKFEEIWLTKNMFHYLTYASMTYRVGIPIATINLCRTAIETGLREKIAEKSEGDNAVKIMNKIKNLEEKTMGSLIKDAELTGIVKENEIKKIFKEFKEDRRILDRFIHGDIMWIKDFVKMKYKEIEVIGAINELEKSKIIANSRTNEIAIDILKSAYKIAEILYFKNLK